jgi:hypothetical protein
VHFLLNQSEVVKGSPSTMILFYNELRTEEISDEAETIFYKIRDFLIEHKAPRFRMPFVIAAIVAAAGSIVFVNRDYEIFKHGQISVGFLICLFVALFFFAVSAQGGNDLKLETRANLPSFWTRNKEAFATHTVTSVISGFVGWILGHYLK